MNDIPILNISNLQLHFNANQPIIKGINLTIKKGEVYALVGESGSGKSLTALSVMRLLPDNANLTGEIRFAESDLFTLTEKQMQSIRGARIGMIFQEPQSALNPVRTIGEHIIEVLQLHLNLSGKKARIRAIELLAEVTLPDPELRIDWYPHQLSGGQKQRAMIACALAAKPDLLIADEPTTALDVTIQAQILELLLQLKKTRQLSILLITHDMGVVAKIADRVGVMRHGELLEEGETQAFFKNPQTQYSKHLIHLLPSAKEFREQVQPKVLLDVQQLNVYFPIQKGLLKRTVGHIKAVDGVDFQIYHGETLAVVGESGSGKSTLGRAIINLQPITNGNIFFEGADIHRTDKKALHLLRKKIQIIFQDPFSSMNPRMRIGEIISEGIRALGLVDKKEEALEISKSMLIKIGLEAEHLDRFPHEFSGGQRQRIAIARALAVEPELIICDEPTSALDVSVRSQILTLLDELQREKQLTYLFITHDLSLIARIAHRVAVMKDGKIIESGVTKKIFESPENEYTRALIAATPIIPK